MSVGWKTRPQKPFIVQLLHVPEYRIFCSTNSRLRKWGENFESLNMIISYLRNECNFCTQFSFLFRVTPKIHSLGKISPAKRKEQISIGLHTELKILSVGRLHIS